MLRAILLAVALSSGSAACAGDSNGSTAVRPGPAPSHAPEGAAATAPAGQQQGADTADSRDAATAAASEFATTFFTYDHRNIDAFTASVRDRSTGSFYKDFAAREGELRTTLSNEQAVADARVLEAAPRDVTDDSAVVLVAIDQQVKNRKAPSGATNRYRLRVTLERVADAWPASAVEPIVDQQDPCGDSSAPSAQQSALESACTSAVRLFSFDYRTYESDLAAQRAVATGAFRDEVEKVTGPTLRSEVQRTHARVAVTVNDAALVSGDAGRAVALVFLNQAVTTDLLDAPRLDRNRVQLDMTKVDGQWLVSGVKAL